MAWSTSKEPLTLPAVEQKERQQSLLHRIDDSDDDDGALAPGTAEASRSISRVAQAIRRSSRRSRPSPGASGSATFLDTDLQVQRDVGNRWQAHQGSSLEQRPNSRIAQGPSQITSECQYQQPSENISDRHDNPANKPLMAFVGDLPRVGSKRKKRGITLKPVAQRIFSGKVFRTSIGERRQTVNVLKLSMTDFVPPNDIAPSRRIRIEKIIQYGGQWAREWHRQVSIIIADDNIDFVAMLAYLCRSSLPVGVQAVNTRYISDCISFGVALDPDQKKYKVHGAPEVEPRQTKVPGLAKERSVASEDASEQKHQILDQCRTQSRTQIATIRNCTREEAAQRG